MSPEASQKDERRDLESVLDRFDQAWQNSKEPKIADYLEQAAIDDSSQRRELLLELIKFDLEYRWQPDPKNSKSAESTADELPLRPTLEDYCLRFSELGGLASLPSDLIAEEYRVHCKAGESPNHDDYLARFPAQAKNLPQALSVVDADFATDETIVPIGKATDFGRFQLLKLLGQGGMGKVYLAMHRRLKKHVAIKMLTPALVDDEAAMSRFQREMEAVGKLDHPNIVRAMDADEIDGTHFLVMNYVEGADLGVISKQIGPLDVADACEVIRQAAVGLAYAHEQGLIHRDIKPSNLMLTESGQVKLLDLGLAQLRSSEETAATFTTTGQIMGTIDYMAPEQAMDARSVDHRADIYSLGCTLYKLLTGEVVFSGPSYDTVGKKLIGHARDSAPSVSLQRQKLPEDLASLLDRMLAKDPDKRPQTASEVSHGLARFSEGQNLSELVAAPIEQSGSTESVRKDWTQEYLSSAMTDTQPPKASGGQNAQSVAGRKGKTTASAISPAKVIGVAVSLGVLFFAAFLVYRAMDSEGTPAADAGKQSGSTQTGSTRPVASQILPETQRELDDFAKRTRGLHGLSIDDPKVAKLRDDLIKWRMPHAGTSAFVVATQLLAKLPCPLDRYGSDSLPPVDPSLDETVPLVAVFGGDATTRHWDVINDLAWSHDGSMIATASCDGSAKILNGQTGHLIRTFGFGHDVGAVAFSPDSEHLAVSPGKYAWSGYANSPVTIWEIETGKKSCEVYRDDTNSAFSDVNAIAFSPDGSQVAFPYLHAIYVADISEKAAAHKIGSHAEGTKIDSVGWSPDGSRIASTSCSSGGDYKTRIWDPKSEELLHSIPCRSQIVFNQDGTGTLSNWDLVDIAGGEKTFQDDASRVKPSDARIWTICRDGIYNAGRLPDGSLFVGERAGRVATRLKGTWGDPYHNAMAFSPDGTRLATAEFRGNSLRMWEVPSGEEIWDQSEICLRESKAAISPDGHYVVRPVADGVTVIDLLSRETNKIKFGFSLPPSNVQFTSCGKFLIADDGSWTAHDYRVVHFPSGQTCAKLRANRLFPIPNDSRLVLSHHEGEQKSVELFDPHNKTATSVPFSGSASHNAPNGRLYGWGNRLCDFKSGKLIYEMPKAVGRRITASVASPDSRTWTFMTTHQLHVFDIGLKRIVKTFNLGGDQAFDAGYSPDGKWLAFVNVNKVNLIDTATWKIVHIFAIGRKNRPVNKVFFSSEGRYLLTANPNGTVYALRLAEPPIRDGRVVDLENSKPSTETDADRFMAKWVLARGGHVLATIPRTGAVLRIHSTDDLPEENFRIETLSFEAAVTPATSALQISSLPEEIGHLTHLKHCVLAKIGFQEVPALLNSSKSLQVLGLGENPIHAKGLARLVNLSELSKLSLSACGLKDGDLEHLPPLNNLKRLTLFGNQLTGAGLAPLKRQTALRLLIPGAEMKFSQSEFDDLRKALPNCLIDHPLMFVDQPELEVARSCQQYAGRLTIAMVAGDHELIINGEQDYLPTDPFSCVEIDLSGNRYYRGGLDLMTKTRSLRALNLAGTSSDDDDVKTLSQLKTLKSLDLRQTKVSAQGLAELRKALPECKILDGPLKAPVSPASISQDYALEFDGKKSIVEIDSLNWDPSTPMTVEMRVVLQAAQTIQTFLYMNNGNAYMHLWARTRSEQVPWGIFDVSVDNRKQFTSHSGRFWRFDLGRSVHVAGVWQDGKSRFFFNGQGAPTADSSELDANRVSDKKNMAIGGWNGRSDGFVCGLIDEVRISNVARYDKNFTPEKRFEPDEHTLALYHFDEGQGDVLRDSSGNGHHGKIHGAKWVKVGGKPTDSDAAKASHPSPTDTRPNPDQAKEQQRK